MPYKPKMPPKMHAIYLLGEEGKCASVTLKDGRTIECRADCYCYVGDDEDEDKDVLALHVFYKGLDTGEILIEDDIESVQSIIDTTSQ